MVENTLSVAQTDISSELFYILEEIEKTELLILETLMTLTGEAHEMLSEDSDVLSKSKKKKRKKHRKKN